MLFSLIHFIWCCRSDLRCCVVLDVALSQEFVLSCVVLSCVVVSCVLCCVILCCCILCRVIIFVSCVGVGVGVPSCAGGVR